MKKYSRKQLSTECDFLFCVSKTKILFSKLIKKKMSKDMAKKNWEMSNNISHIDSIDEVYRYNREEQQDILAAKPWSKE